MRGYQWRLVIWSFPDIVADIVKHGSFVGLLGEINDFVTRWRVDKNIQKCLVKIRTVISLLNPLERRAARF